jgi:hypothetical protein
MKLWLQQAGFGKAVDSPEQAVSFRSQSLNFIIRAYKQPRARNPYNDPGDQRGRARHVCRVIWSIFSPGGASRSYPNIGYPPLLHVTPVHVGCHNVRHNGTPGLGSRSTRVAT